VRFLRYLTLINLHFWSKSGRLQLMRSRSDITHLKSYDIRGEQIPGTCILYRGAYLWVLSKEHASCYTWRPEF
jgi:hypothetical protein